VDGPPTEGPPHSPLLWSRILFHRCCFFEQTRGQGTILFFLTILSVLLPITTGRLGPSFGLFFRSPFFSSWFHSRWLKLLRSKSPFTLFHFFPCGFSLFEFSGSQDGGSPCTALFPRRVQNRFRCFYFLSFPSLTGLFKNRLLADASLPDRFPLSSFPNQM